jgi:hypothetical protein
VVAEWPPATQLSAGRAHQLATRQVAAMMRHGDPSPPQLVEMHWDRTDSAPAVIQPNVLNSSL